MPWKSNPNPNSAKGEAMAIPNVLDEMRGMTPENRALVRQGKQFDVATRLGEGTLKVDKAMRMLADPQSTLAKELQMAGGPLRERIPAWGEAMRRQNEVMPKGLLSTTPRGESVMSNLAESAGPTLRVTAVRAFRRALGHQLEKDLVRRGVEDAAIARLATATPQEFSAFFKQYGIVDEQVRNAVRAAAVAASTAGRSASGGLLAPR
jgi:hypothetical protein